LPRTTDRDQFSRMVTFTIGKMLIYPDTSDLINLCRGAACIDISDLARLLVDHDHRVVLSLETLVEFAAPLKEDKLLEVRKDLNQIEELPHTFVNEGRIYDSELREAVTAFAEGREYTFASVTPFAPRLDEAIDLHGKPLEIVQRGRPVPTRMIVNFRLFDVIDYLWKYDRHIFDVQRRREPQWIQVMKADREMTQPPKLRDHFVTMMARALAEHQIQSPAAGIDGFARWVYESPSRCPGVRLTYETHHRFRRDKTAEPAASDIIDLARIPSVPYVDFFIADKKMMVYCAQAAKEIGLSYPQLHGDLRSVVSYLGGPLT
jgi:hypothetical protein